MLLSEIITPNTAVARSVNLERDMGDENTLRQYLLTGKGLEIISRLVSGLNGEKISAWSLTGPYGMGKSAFSNFLLSLCGPGSDRDSQSARKILLREHADLAEKFENVLKNRRIRSKGLFRIPVTAAFQSVNRTLAKGLHRALMQGGTLPESQKQELIRQTEALLSQEKTDAQVLAGLFAETARAAGTPIALVIDEFGKNLEYMAKHPDQGDIFIVQTLAEAEDIFLWVCLHQAFDEYASGFSQRQIQEWGKVQGRFEDVVFVEPKLQMLRFIQNTLVRKEEKEQSGKMIRAWAHACYQQITDLDLTEFRGIGAEDIRSFYPLHPLTALLLPELCIRFAQNDRTLFAFLCGGEPNALPAFLSSQSMDADAGTLPVLGIEYLYDYFLGDQPLSGMLEKILPLFPLIAEHCQSP